MVTKQVVMLYSLCYGNLGGKVIFPLYYVIHLSENDDNLHGLYL